MAGRAAAGEILKAVRLLPHKLLEETVHVIVSTILLSLY